MLFGFTSTSFRQIKSLEKIVTIASECGAQCIEWGGDVHIKDVDTAKKAKILCQQNNIKICSYGSYYRVGSGKSDYWRNICEIASALGADSVRVWLGTKDSEKYTEDMYRSLVDDAKAVCRVAKEYNLLVCAECHDNTYNNNTDSFLRIRNDIGCDNFKTYFQSRYKKLDYDLDRIERTIPYIENIHISFSELRREQFPKYKPEYIDALLKKIMSVNFSGVLLVEYTYLFSHMGNPASMKKDIAEFKTRVGVK